jgi:[ribosomal protein S18]-alanine N-acetyltransferase
MTQVLIREAHMDEAPRLAAIGFAAWERDLLPFLSGAAASRENERARILRAAQDGLRRTIVAEVDGEAVGWCTRTRAYIPFIFVEPDLQNHGIGRLLLRRTESLLELEGQDRVQLDTLADNVRAVRFYEHQGYQILAMKPKGPVTGGGYFGVRLEKRLFPFSGPVPDLD